MWIEDVMNNNMFIMLYERCFFKFPPHKESSFPYILKRNRGFMFDGRVSLYARAVWRGEFSVLHSGC